MSVEYPWLVANGRLPVLFEKIASAARPDKFSQDFLEKLGLSSSNDRALIPLLRRLGFLNESNQPTSAYDLLRDPQERAFALADGIRETYGDLFAINTNLPKASDQEIKGAITRVTGKDETTVDRNFKTLKALLQLANFERKKPIIVAPDIAVQIPKEPVPILDGVKKESRKSSFHYNIQIILPATTEIAVYNAIFKSLKDNLDI